VEVDRNAALFASGEVRIAAAPELVWDVLTGFEEWPNWNPGVRSMSFRGPVAAGTVFVWKPGATRITSRLAVVERPREIGWTGKTFGVQAVHVWRFEPSNGGTRASAEESFDGFLARLLPGVMRSALQKGVDSGLQTLKAEAERRALEHRE
jgi:hypothetical protein